MSNTSEEITNLHDALVHLKIDDFENRIINSNSHGELFHITTYIQVANMIPENNTEKFSEGFRKNVKHAEETWERPESVFQHLDKMF